MTEFFSREHNLAKLKAELFFMTNEELAEVAEFIDKLNRP